MSAREMGSVEGWGDVFWEMFFGRWGVWESGEKPLIKFK